MNELIEIRKAVEIFNGLSEQAKINMSVEDLVKLLEAEAWK
jgi:hypothetical protein